MNMDILDAISELQITLDKITAIHDGFMQQYTMQADKKLALLSIETHYKNYQNTAHVICDLLGKATEQMEALEGLADAAWKEQQQA